jgi:hypothetical protein
LRDVSASVQSMYNVPYMYLHQAHVASKVPAVSAHGRTMCLQEASRVMA